MNRSTVKYISHKALKCRCVRNNYDQIITVNEICPQCYSEEDVPPYCDGCGFLQVVEKLAAYEDTELSPTEVVVLKADNARLHKLLYEVEGIIANTSKKEGGSV